MSYREFAYLYDTLMEDVPYERWVDWVISLHSRYGRGEKKLLDLACGTGELSVRLSHAGFNVTGVDLSEDMLAVAQAKAGEAAMDIPFFHQDMTQLDSLGEYDVIGIFCDSLNYLPRSEDVAKAFAGVNGHLKKEGLFLFDVHSIHKMDDVFAGSPFTYIDEEVSYIWNCFPGEHPHSVEHELTFFVLDDETGQYDRVDESHFQRTFEISEYKKMLEEAGFELLGITADFQQAEPGPEAERILFAARKKA
ncbi:class I SAM-dependent methyltransferase [Bacillus sp. FJAT-27251]|uniref:class I SAM-dependent DNA methyltransferase n=1 Tax=Bacillus sp. FJAT-27251 TaxID=1684142 RepID=UPI0006A76B27|nr:class I SAM-dependent methyltransferase [Bacillus sp. FJAT-27251]